MKQDAHTTADATIYPHIVVPDLPEPEESDESTQTVDQADEKIFPLLPEQPCNIELDEHLAASESGTEDSEEWLEKPRQRLVFAL